MSLQSEQIPNRSLTGEELRQIAVKQFDEMLQKDFSKLDSLTAQVGALRVLNQPRRFLSAAAGRAL